MFELNKGSQRRPSAARCGNWQENAGVKNSPLEYPSAGSTFKRPEGYFAAKLIEDAGLKGFSVGGAMVSEKHSGFVINYNDATASDVMELCRQVREKVKALSGVELEMEVKMAGRIQMKLVIVTGMSGAGKTIALKMLEDIGFYCVDNLPISLVDKFVQLVSEGTSIEKAALGLDIRSGEELGNLDEILENWRSSNVDVQVLFLDANDAVLIKRYKETRRTHPLAGAGRLENGIEKEREKLAFLKREADYIIDTSMLLTRELRKELEKIFLQDARYKNMYVTVLSFGFKYGIPEDADLVFDVRFLPNPYYDETLTAYLQVRCRQYGTM